MFDCRKNGSKIQVPDVLPKSELRSCRPMLENIQLGDARNDVGARGRGEASYPRGLSRKMPK